jgi:hypothetical protein
MTAPAKYGALLTLRPALKTARESSVKEKSPGHSEWLSATIKAHG